MNLHTMNGPHAITAMNVAPLCLHCFDQNGESVNDNAEGLLVSELSSFGVSLWAHYGNEF